MIHRRDEHLPFRWLVERADGSEEGSADASRASECDEHLDGGCALCATRLVRLRHVLAAIAAGPLDAVPESVDRRVLALYESNRIGSGWAPGGAIVGSLVVDQLAGAAGGLRSATADVRHLLWTLAEYELDARVVPAAGGCDLLAQVLPMEEGAADGTNVPLRGHVRAVRGRRTVAESEIERDGRFTFRGLRPGGYTFEGDVRGRPFVLPLVVLG